MKEFNVIIEDNGIFKPYDIIPYLMDMYNEKKKKERPVTFEECKKFIEKESMYQWWSRCQYEIILSNWPNQDKSEKWDVHRQVMMNIDIITEIFIKCIEDGNKE